LRSVRGSTRLLPDLLQRLLQLLPLFGVLLQSKRPAEAAVGVLLFVQLVEVDGSQSLPDVAATRGEAENLFIELGGFAGAAELVGGVGGVFDRGRVGGVAAGGFAEAGEGRAEVVAFGLGDAHFEEDLGCQRAGFFGVLEDLDRFRPAAALSQDAGEVGRRFGLGGVEDQGAAVFALGVLLLALG